MSSGAEVGDAWSRAWDGQAVTMAGRVMGFRVRVWQAVVAVLLGFGAVIAPVGASPVHQSVRAADEIGDLIVEWDRVARDVITRAEEPAPTHFVWLAAVHLAIYDAVVAIEGGYEPYVAAIAPSPDASVEAAIGAAARGVLIHDFPEQADEIEAAWERTLALVEPGPAMDAGISVGEAAAAAIIGRDEEAGLSAEVDLAPPTPAPGTWEPPEGRSAVAPWLASFRPFTLETPDQFRPGPPPALTSPAYAADYDETLRLGAADSDERSRRQTRIAWFYTAPGAEQVNAALGDIVSARELSAIDVARLYALVDAAAADAMVACFDAKYHYWSWRPDAAIANADRDGNDATAPRDGWMPLFETPAHPEYPSAHACFFSAVGDTLAALLGTESIDLTLSNEIGVDTMPTRHFATVRDLTDEVVDARVWAGIHFRTSDETGIALGRDVASWAIEHILLPASDEQDP